MLNFAGTSPLVATPETDSHQLIEADLRSLIARIEGSVRLIDAAMAWGDVAREDMTGEDDSTSVGSTDVFVLDDVTPRYAAASAALNACRAGLGHVLECLSDSDRPA